MIDTNVNLFRWPFRSLAGDEPAELVANLRKKGVTQAWAGSFEGLLHRDVAGVNARLADACRRYGPNFLVPFGTVNPKQPDWQEELRRCAEVHKMPGIRLHPNYHGYTLDDPVVTELFALTESHKLLVEIALAMEDDRAQHPLMRIPPVDPAPLLDLAKRLPNLRLVLINGGSQGILQTEHIPELAKTGSIYFDIARLDGIGCVARLVEQTSPSRVVFGSHYPFFYFESSFLKVREAGLPDDQAKAVFEGNARALLRR
jgi:predicted TIM-barrel fold metal-dependent hydrolase